MKKGALAVDIIIPTYNGLPWLEKTVRSVLDQTYKNFTLYIIDDGSTDKTAAYVKALKDKRVRYLHKANGGQSTARNVGIKASTSPLLAFLDSDDIWYPTKLEKQVAIMEKKPKVGMVYGHYYLIDEADEIITYLQIWKRGRIFDDLLNGNIIAGSASMVLIRREVFDTLGLFKEDFLIGEDWEMWLRIANSYDIDFVPEIIAGLRHRHDGMQKNYKKMADGLVYAYGYIVHEFRMKGWRKRRFANATLYTATELYMRAGFRTKAKITLLKLFAQSPSAFFANGGWKIHYSTSFFMKAIFSTKIVRYATWQVRRTERYAGRSIKAVLGHSTEPGAKQ
ncbi:MAG: glycosyltransferase [Candidatus Saccharibacteria bacterium]|nr:glycosyltransferase [Candidatus Saccharibacteria bacterium]